MTCLSALLSPTSRGYRLTRASYRDTFVYEYVGEVIGPVVFARKMKEYGAEGIRHFYFMALDKDIVRSSRLSVPEPELTHALATSSSTRPSAAAKVDSSTTRATPTASLPNGPSGARCAWASSLSAISRRTRSSRSTTTSIVTGAFSFLADRAGLILGRRRHTAQECYCGEPNCVGYIGGKTQTDIGGMDDLYLEGARAPFPQRTLADAFLQLWGSRRRLRR